jgi:hypothetical protein
MGQVQAAGFRAIAAGIDWDEADKLCPEAQERYYDQQFIHNWFYSGLRARTSVPTLLELFESWRPDVLVHESLGFGAALAGELATLRHAVVEIAAWEEAGALDMRERARLKARELLGTHWPAHLPEAVDQQIRAEFDIRLPRVRMTAGHA